MEACVCICREDGPDINDSTFDDFDPSYGDGEVLHFDSIVSAEKEHRCIECGFEIKIGTEYEYVRARYEGKWSEYHTCIGCQRVRDDLFKCGFTYGQVWGDLCEAWVEQLHSEDLTEEELEQAENDICEMCDA